MRGIPGSSGSPAARSCPEESLFPGIVRPSDTCFCSIHHRSSQCKAFFSDSQTFFWIILYTSVNFNLFSWRLLHTNPGVPFSFFAIWDKPFPGDPCPVTELRKHCPEKRKKPVPAGNSRRTGCKKVICVHFLSCSEPVDEKPLSETPAPRM